MTQFFWSNYVDSSLVDIMGGVISIVATVAFLKFWKPKKIWRFDYDEKAKSAAPPVEGIADASGGEWTAEDFAENLAARSYPFGKVLKAWMPFAILSIAVLLWGLPKVKLALNQATTPAFKVVQPDGKVRPGPPGWDVPICTMRSIVPLRWWTNRSRKLRAMTSTGYRLPVRGVLSPPLFRDCCSVFHRSNWSRPSGTHCGACVWP